MCRYKNISQQENRTVCKRSKACIQVLYMDSKLNGKIELEWMIN